MKKELRKKPHHCTVEKSNITRKLEMIINANDVDDSEKVGHDAIQQQDPARSIVCILSDKRGRLHQLETLSIGEN